MSEDFYKITHAGSGVYTFAHNLPLHTAEEFIRIAEQRDEHNNTHHAYWQGVGTLEKEKWPRFNIVKQDKIHTHYYPLYFFESWDHWSWEKDAVNNPYPVHFGQFCEECCPVSPEYVTWRNEQGGNPHPSGYHESNHGKCCP